MKNLIFAVVFSAVLAVASVSEAGPLRCLVQKVASVQPVKRVLCAQPVRKVVGKVQPVRRAAGLVRSCTGGQCCQ